MPTSQSHLRQEEEQTLENLAREQEFERDAVEIFLRETYSHKVPQPIAPTPQEMGFAKIAGLDVTMLAVSAIGAILFSALRTGQLFFIIETALFGETNPFLANAFGFLSMILALFCFEGFVFATSFYKGRHLKNVRISNVGIFLSMLVIVIAGIFSGLPLITLPENILIIFNTVVAVLTAFSAAFIVYFSSENIGFAVSNVDRIREEKKENHLKAYQHWRDAGVKSYNSSKTFNVRKAGVTKNPSTIPSQVLTAIEPKENKSELTYRTIEQYHKTNGKLPTVRELNELAGVSVGTAQNALREYRERNNIIQPFRD